MKKIFIIILSIISFVFGTLVSPSDGDELNYIHILFEWEQQPDAIGYNLKVSTNEVFNNLILDVDETYTVYIDSDNFNWNETYYWKVRPVYSDENYGDWIGTSMFSISQSTPPYIDEGVEIESSTDIYQDDLLEDGYVAIGAFNPEPHSFIIDKYGNEIWWSGILSESENLLSDGFMLNHINEYGNISGYSGLNYPNNTGTKINFDLDFLWSAPTPEIQVDMHEFKQISNGNYMGFQNVHALGPIPSDNYMTETFQDIGYQADGITPEFPWYGQKIVEWNSDHEVVWSWNPFDHFTMDDFDNYGGTWSMNVLAQNEYDWLHSNAFHFDEEESVIYVSHRHLSRISKIAYPSGDVIWNMGLPAEYNTGENNICTELGFSFQHNIQLLEDGTLLFFDNGYLSQVFLEDEYQTTRIRRVRVINNSYCETEWEYELPPNLYGSATGSVQLLDNGNYSIYTIASGSVIEVTPEQEIIWKYTGNISNSWGWYYRAYKIPSIHPDAFSVIADNYTVDENNNNIIQISGNSLDFTIINKSGYTQPYQFSFGESTDGPPMFDYEEGDFSLGPNESIELSFAVLDGNISSTNINFSIWPVHHDYALKELSYNITTNDTLLGDVNSDGFINILDVISMINIILTTGEYNVICDVNEDGMLNILDVVTLVNWILN